MGGTLIRRKMLRTLRPIASRAVYRNARTVHVVSKPEAGGQAAPSYKYKFLKEPATTAVSQLHISQKPLADDQIVGCPFR